MRDYSTRSPHFILGERSPTCDQAHQSRVKEEKRVRPFGQALTAVTEGLKTPPCIFTPCAAPVISFGGPVAEEKMNVCHTFRMANDGEPVEKVLMTSLSVAVTFEDSVNSNLATLMVDSGASGHYFDDAIIRDLKTPSAGLLASRYAPHDSHCRGSSVERFGRRRAVKVLSVTITATKSSFG